MLTLAMMAGLFWQSSLFWLFATAATLEQRSVYDQIIEPKKGSFVASRTRPSGARHTTVGAIVTGAPVPARQETAAEAFFDDLMTK
jgi:hypothetical protein